MDFISSSAAIDFCVANKLAGVHLVFKFEEQEYDIVLPVIPMPELSAKRSHKTM